jgi:hypothetical protein
MFLNVFGNSYLRRLIINSKNLEQEQEQIKRLYEFIKLLASYLDAPAYISKVVRNSDKLCVYMEHLMLFYMLLLYEYNKDIYSNEEQGKEKQGKEKQVFLKSYFVTTYAYHFFIIDFHTLFSVKPLVYDNGVLQKDPSGSSPPLKAVPFVVKFLYKTTIAIQDDDNSLELFHSLGDRQYTLTSLTVRNYKATKEFGHAAGIYRDGQRFYSWENNRVDMYLLEHSILNLDLQIDWWDRERLFLNANKGERICIYTPTIPVFTSDEVELLRELARYLYDKKVQSVSKPIDKQDTFSFSKLFKCFRPKRIHPSTSGQGSSQPIFRCIAIFLYY